MSNIASKNRMLSHENAKENAVEAVLLEFFPMGNHTGLQRATEQAVELILSRCTLEFMITTFYWP
ncbi:hypothetical protein AB432_030195 [Brevibacillus brevis]|uniref:Uncharacterized protein n=1 Tax=Brevibacillus brevis TaxID=1393 RepID=A0A2Z4MSD5_BREBE|nr:hypothetical protein AB432_030195 [Brevibacillus brevis]